MRFGYEPHADPQRDSGVIYVRDAGVEDAAKGGKVHAGVGGASGSAGVAGQASAGAPGGNGSSGAAGSAGAPASAALGDTGLLVTDILGFYSGDWGDMVLEQRAAEIWGVYNYNDGTIVGAIASDGVFEGWWSQLPTRADGINAGEVEFRWSRSNAGLISLDGRWRYGTSGAWLENWDVDLVTDRQAPSTLTAAFQDTADFKRHP